MPHLDERALTLELYPHRHTLQTRSTDCSASNGHIPNGRIAEFGDEGRLGLHQAIMGEENPAELHLVESNFRFLAELRFPGPVTIGVGLVGIGNSSLRMVAGYFRDGHCLVRARFAVVKVHRGSSTALTPDERRRAEPYLIAALAEAC